MRPIRTLGCLIALLAPGTAAAQGQPGSLSLTLAAAQRLATERGGARQARLAQLDVDRARGRQAGALANPLFAVRTERTGADQTAANELIAEIIQPLDLGGVARRRGKAGAARAEGTLAAVATTEADLLLEVTTAYWRAVVADRRLALAERALTSFDRASRIGAERRRAGDLSGLAQRRLELEAARFAAIRATAALAQRVERARLGSLIAEPGELYPLDRLVLVDSLAPGAPATEAIDVLIATALAGRSELHELAAKGRAAEADVETERRTRWPMPALTAGFKTETNGSVRQSGLVAGLTVPVPVFDRRAGAVAAAGAERAAATAWLDHQRRAVTLEVITAYESLRAIEAQRAALAPRLGDEAVSALAAAEVAFAEGEIGVTEWLDTIRAYHEAATALAVLTAETAIERARLDRATGRLGRTS